MYSPTVRIFQEGTAPMKEMAELLDAIVQQIVFTVSTKRRREIKLSSVSSNGGARTTTTLDVTTLGKFTSDELRELHTNNKWRSGEWGEELAIIPEISDIRIRELNTKLHSMLEAYMEGENEHIRHGLTDSIDGQHISSVRPNGFENTERLSSKHDFCNYLLIGTAILGSKRIAQYLDEWMAGIPIHYQTIALLVGLTIEHPLVLQEGISISYLPTSSNELPNSLPSYGSVAAATYLSGVILSINCEAIPALYKPMDNPKENEKSIPRIQHTWALKESSLDNFCESLSLACNVCVRYKQIWRDYGELIEFSAISIKLNMPMRLIVDKKPETPISQEQLQHAWNINRQRDPIKEKQGLGTAISRWVNSKRPESNLADRFIDLRIALEALYLTRDRAGGLSFRLSTHGALHLGQDIHERRRYYKTFRKTYNIGSKAIHAGTLEDTPENQGLLTIAQDLCREGILKRLSEEKEPNWGDMILGVDI